jgi:hypothetical protein
MSFSDPVEKLIERAVNILHTGENVIQDEFTRFNTIYIGNIHPDRVTFELQLTLPEIARVLNYDLDRFFQDRDFNFEDSNIDCGTVKTSGRSPFIGICEMDYAAIPGIFHVRHLAAGSPGNTRLMALQSSRASHPRS